MDRSKLAAVAGFSYLLYTGYGLVGELGAGAPEGQEVVAYSSSNPNGNATLRGGIEHINWDGGSGFAALHESRGLGKDNSALGDFLRRNNINTGSYQERQSLRNLASSLNPFRARQDYEEAKRSGQAPEVVSHFQYLAELAQAYRDGTLPALFKRWFGTSDA